MYRSATTVNRTLYIAKNQTAEMPVRRIWNSYGQCQCGHL